MFSQVPTRLVAICAPFLAAIFAFAMVPVSASGLFVADGDADGLIAEDGSVHVRAGLTGGSSSARLELFPPIIDCNSNTFDDGAEIIAGTSPDCNSNGVPDECEAGSDLPLAARKDTGADECVDAVSICPGVRYQGSTAMATSNAFAASCGDDVPTRDVWYRYVAATDGTLELALCGSSFDTVLSVYADCPVGTSGIEIECNDDDCGLQSGLSLDVTAGTTYYILIGGYDEDDFGSYVLTAEGPGCARSDCNSNGILDDCDLLAGTALDTNMDQRLDECEIAAGSGADCNSNGILDELEIGASDALNVPNPDDSDDDDGTGLFFDITALTDLTVTAFEAYSPLEEGEPGSDPVGPVTMAFYTRPGTSQGFETAGMGAWTLLQRFAVPLQNSSSPYFFPLDVPFDMATGETVGVYVIGEVGGIQWADVCDVEFFDNGELSMRVELGSDVPFTDDDGDLDDCMSFRGAVHYGLPGDDCNTNSVPDDCDIAGGTSADVNNNDVPDECETIAAERVTETEKGSALLYSLVELRYDAMGNLIGDTFITLTNDYNLAPDVTVQMYFVNGDPRPDLESAGGDLPPWNFADANIRLTPDQPAYWSAGEGRSLSASGLGFDIVGAPIPDPNGSGDFVIRGYLLAFAVNAAGEEIRWNYLFGEATLVDYVRGTAWSYHAYAFRALDPAVHGQPTGTPGVINLDGVEFAAPFDQLLFNFLGDRDNGAFSAVDDNMPVTVNTALTLLPVSADFTTSNGIPGEPVSTRAQYVIHNENENKKTNTARCVVCWDQIYLGDFSNPNWFLATSLGTDAGKAAVDGVASFRCDLDFDPDDGKPLGDDYRDLLSEDAALLGVIARHLDFDGMHRDVAGHGLIGRGLEAAVIRFPVANGGGPTDESPADVVPVDRPAGVRTLGDPGLSVR